MRLVILRFRDPLRRRISLQWITDYRGIYSTFVTTIFMIYDLWYRRDNSFYDKDVMKQFFSLSNHPSLSTRLGDKLWRAVAHASDALRFSLFERNSMLESKWTRHLICMSVSSIFLFFFILVLFLPFILTLGYYYLMSDLCILRKNVRSNLNESQNDMLIIDNSFWWKFSFPCLTSNYAISSSTRVAYWNYYCAIYSSTLNRYRLVMELNI